MKKRIERLIGIIDEYFTLKKEGRDVTAEKLEIWIQKIKNIIYPEGERDVGDVGEDDLPVIKKNLEKDKEQFNKSLTPEQEYKIDRIIRSRANELLSFLKNIKPKKSKEVKENG